MQIQHFYFGTAFIYSTGVWISIGMAKSKNAIIACVKHAPQSKNAVCANIKHGRYFHLTSNFWSINFHAKKLYVQMFDTVDTLFSYGRGLIVC